LMPSISRRIRAHAGDETITSEDVNGRTCIAGGSRNAKESPAII
jgi:hypothetical protein